MSAHRNGTESGAKLLRLDVGHARAGRHLGAPVLRARRVRQLLTGSAGAGSQKLARATARHVTPLQLCSADPADQREYDQADNGVVKRFRDNVHTLAHIAGDPLVWSDERGDLLSDVRETLSLTETALRQVEATAAEPARRSADFSGVLALVDAVDQRVDRLFDRMEHLTGLRQRAARLGAILANLPFGLQPRAREIEALARETADAAGHDDLLTLVQPESGQQAAQLGAHAVNVAELVARMAATEPEWREELPLAISAALLADCGMMRVPADIFHSAQPLTHTQRSLIQRHPIASASIVEQMAGRDERLVAAVYQHHERLDGSGYPDGVCAEAISPVARLLAVADSYVSLQSWRPHRPALSAEQALRDLEQATAQGRLDAAWVRHLPVQPPHWLKLPVQPRPPSGATAVSAVAA